jgi:glycosyltransferase involved in cell wall biosynthesis
MRVMIVGSYMSNWTYHISKAFSENGHKCYFLNPDQQFQSKNLFSNIAGSNTYLSPLIMGNLHSRFISTAISKLKPDIVVSTNFHSLYTKLPAGNYYRLYYIHRALKQWPISYINPLMYTITKPYTTLTDFMLLKRAKAGFILANSKYTLSYYLASGVNGGVVYYPVDLNNLKTAARKENLVVSIGRISRERRHEDTLAIAALVPDVPFVIMGFLEDKRYYDELLARKPKNVTIKTDVPYNDLCKILASAKIYVGCRYMETFGVGVIQGMASGCVPVVRDHGAVKETVTSDVGFRWNSFEEAASQIKNLLTDKRSCEEKSNLAVEKAKLFSPENFRKRIINVLSDAGILV